MLWLEQAGGREGNSVHLHANQPCNATAWKALQPPSKGASTDCPSHHVAVVSISTALLPVGAGEIHVSNTQQN